MSDRKITLQLEITLPDNAAPGTEEALLASLRSPSAAKRLTVYSLILGLAAPWQAWAGDKPIACQGADCSGRPFVEFGNVDVPNMVGGTVNDSVMNINQYSEKALLNWKSFNVGATETVNFNQVSDSAVALNRIHDQSPSHIFGKLNANGHVYLLNGSGVVFEQGSQINVRSLLATTLDLDDEIFKDSSIFARFDQFDSGDIGDTSLAGLFAGVNSKDDAEIINQGTIIAENGGNILLAAPTVKNEGKIQTEDGQIILAGAKDRLYIIPSESSDLRGFLVEVGGDGGAVTNEAAAEIFAKRGNATLLASEIHQKGKIKASTDTGVAGSVFLLARDHADNFRGDQTGARPIFAPESASADAPASEGVEGDLANSVTLYENSLTEIELELATAATAIDAVEQKRSRIDIEGKQIDIRSDSDIVAKNGQLNIVAAEKGVLRYVKSEDKTLTHQLQTASDTRPEQLEDYRVFIDSGANIDLSGSDAQLSVQDHLVEVELFSNELKDSPVQKDGVLRGKTIVVDAREGTPLADIKGATDNVQKSLAERTTEGGDVRIWSDGDIVVKDDAVIDISGGITHYTGGYINTSKLMVDGRIVDVGDARPDIIYDGIRDSRRGISLARYEEGYTEGHDAGSVQLAAHALALDGDIKADTHNGIHQKNADDQAQGGTLTIGFQGEEYLDRNRENDINPDFRAPNLQFVDQSSSQNSPLSASFDRTDALSSERNEDLFVLSNRFSDLGIQHYELTSNGEIVMGERGVDNAPLPSIDLGAGASVRAEAVQVTVNQGLNAAGGTIDLNAEFDGFSDNAQVDQYFNARPQVAEIKVKEGVSLDVSGVWSNDRKDYVIERRPDNDAISIDGGSITLAGDQVTLEDRVSLDVGGSAHLDEDGKLHYGKGGALALKDNDAERGEFTLGQDLRFDGTAFQDGGTLSITAPSLVLTDRFADSLTSVKAGNANGVLAINSSTFRDHGFAEFDLTALSNRDVVLAGLDEAGNFALNPETIAGDLLVKTDFDGRDLQQSNWVFPLLSGSPQLTQVENPTLATGRLNLVEIDSQAELDSLVTRGQLSDHDRGAMQIDLTLKKSGSEFVDIRVEQGAALDLDAHKDSRFALTNQTGGDIDIDRDIRVHGGEIDLTLNRDIEQVFNLESALYVRDGATLDVSGVFERDLSQPNFLIGEMLKGGSIDLSSSGFILLEAGSQLDASGTVATVDALGQNRPGQTIQNGRVQQASTGGAITLNSDEGSRLAGALNLAGGTAAQAGGTLKLRSNFSGSASNEQFQAPANQDRVQLVDDVTLPETLASTDEHGITQLHTDTLANSGTSHFSVQANQWQMQADQNLILPGSLQLEVDKIHVAPVIGDTTATPASLKAGYVLLGNLETTPRKAPTDALQPATDAQGLMVDAKLIDLSGKLALENVSDLTLHSEGDVRLRQENRLFKDLDADPAGLKMNGDLTIEADRVYAVSNTHYEIEVGGENGSVSLLGNGTAASTLPVLSANTQVDINADSILVDTEVATPFGELNLDAEGTLTLGDNARLRASADGEKVPYGYTLNGREWYYGLPGGNLLDAEKVLTSSGVNIPKAAVNLKADTIDMQDGAVIDVSNSGDLVATEFIPGTGGSYDYLAQGFSPSSGGGRFAMLPAQDAGYAPFDQRISADFTHAMGTQIVLGAGSGAPAGTYTLLPAEYAQLEGAYIVNLEPKLNLQPGRNSTLPDGTPVSSAYLFDGMSNQISSDYFAVSVRPGSDANLFSEYRRSEMKDFAPTALARLQQSMTGSVFDAGSIGIDVLSDLNLSGSILGQGDADSATARDARIDIAAAQLRVVNTLSDQPGNYVELRADQVNQLAEGGSLLLGGQRSESVVDGRTVTRIDATAQEVIVAADAELQAATLLLSADQSIRLESGARIQSADLPNRNLQAGSVQSFHIGDGSALLAVSDQRIGAVTRAEGETGTANIALAEGSQLDAASLLLDATGHLTLDGTITSRGGDVFLGAEQFALSNVAQETASQLSQSVLDNLSSALSLTLRSDDALLVGAGIDLDAKRLTLDSVGLNSQLDGGSARINADTLLLKGGNSAASQPENLDNSGTLDISALATEVQGGAFSLFGAESVTIDSGEALVLSKTTNLDFIGQDDVTLAANRIALNTGSVAQMSSTGDLALTQSQPSTTPRTLPQMLGGKLSVTAETLTVDTHIEAHSGVIELASSQNLTLGEHAKLDASGQDIRIQDFVAHTRGGRVTLGSGADLTLDDAATIDVSGAGVKEAAGTVELFSRQGALNLGAEILADAGAEAQGGRLRIDTATFGSAASLSDVLKQAQASGFDRQVDVRVREQDAQIAQDVTLTVDKIAISADQAMTVAGTLGTGTARAGELALSANEGLTLASTARLNMNSTDAGGEITLASRGETGAITLTNGAQVSLGEKDRLTLAADRTENGVQITGNVNNLVSSTTGGVRVLGSDQIELGSTLGNADVTSALTDAQSWMTHESAMNAALGLEGLGLRAEIAPELLFTSTQDLTVSATNLDLGSTVFGSTSRHGHLGILSAGDLTLTTDISDGFGTGEFIPSQSKSFDFTLAAGADLTSAGLTDTQAADAVLTVGTGVHVRTGDGDIDLVSGGDIVLQAQDSVVYTAGQDSGFALDKNNNDTVLTTPSAYKLRAATPTQGGDLRIQAGGDIRGGSGVNDRSQLFVDWLVTQKDQNAVKQRFSITRPALDAGMWINYANFKQGFSAMGGGDLSIEAGGELTRVSASVPTTIHYDNQNTVLEVDPVNGLTPVNQGGSLVQQRFGEGHLQVEARGNIASPDILVGDGQGTLFSESSFSIARQVGTQRYDAAANVALMGGQLQAESLQDMNLSLLLDPGLMDFSTLKVDAVSHPQRDVRLNGDGLFFTTTIDSAFDFRSVAGNLNYSPNGSLMTDLASSTLDMFNSSFGMNIPAMLTMQSLMGDLKLGAGSDLSQVVNPAAEASIELLAGRNIDSNISFKTTITNSEDMPDAARQMDKLVNLNSFISAAPKFQTETFRSTEDRDSSRMIAGNNIRVNKEFVSAEDMDINAGGSFTLNNAALTIFHNHLDSVSHITAKNSISLENKDGGLDVVGSGQLLIAAGGDINLGISKGITTSAGLVSPAYSAFPAADITLLAGATLDQMNGSALLAALATGTALDAGQISDFIAAVDDASEENVTRIYEAIMAFYTLPADQRETISQSFSSEQAFQRFVNQALLTDTLRGALDKPEFFQALYQQMEHLEDGSGQEAMLTAVQKFTRLPVTEFRRIETDDNEDEATGISAEELLGDMGYDLKTRIRLIDSAFRLLPETTQLAITHSLVSSATDAQRSVLGRAALFGELNASGVLANSQGREGYDSGFNALASVFDGIDYLGDLKSESSYRGDIDIFYSRVYSLEGGDINMLTPGGSINGGVVTSPDGTKKEASQLGVVVQQKGDVNAFMQGSYLVNQSRVFTLEKGGILMWASEGNIDAGKGAKTAVAIPPPTIVIVNGQPIKQTDSAIVGSGIRQFDNQAGQCDVFCELDKALGLVPEDKAVNLIAPNGEVNAGDAGIGAAGDINIAAARVVGADNIDVGGVSVGVPVDAGGLSAGLSGLGSVASDATKNAAESATTDTENAAPLGEEALAWLEVFVLGYGDEEEEKERL